MDRVELAEAFLRAAREKERERQRMLHLNPECTARADVLAWLAEQLSEDALRLLGDEMTERARRAA